jgi:hypothetical protein
VEDIERAEIAMVGADGHAMVDPDVYSDQATIDHTVVDPVFLPLNPAVIHHEPKFHIPKNHVSLFWQFIIVLSTVFIAADVRNVYRTFENITKIIFVYLRNCLKVAYREAITSVFDSSFSNNAFHGDEKNEDGSGGPEVLQTCKNKLAKAETVSFDQCKTFSFFKIFEFSSSKLPYALPYFDSYL